MKSFFVYMVTNQARTVLYIGVTNELNRRVWEHQNGYISGFTKKYNCDRLVYFDNFPEPTAAIAREKQLKGWTRAEKNALVDTLNPSWADLSRTILNHLRGPSPSHAAQDDTGKVTRAQI